MTPATLPIRKAITMSPSRGRRNFLKQFSLGCSGGLLLPMLDRLALGAEGALPPLRFLFVLEGNSLPPLQVHPRHLAYVPREQRISTTVDDLRPDSLPLALQPVREFCDRLTVIQGLSGRMCSGGHSSDHGALGAYHANQGRNIQGPTVDAVLGQSNRGVFENLVLGISSRANVAVDFNCSAAGVGRSLATIMDPQLAFNKLFGSVSRGSAKADYEARRQVLDFMLEDIRHVRQRLGAMEHEKLDTYEGSFESLRSRSDQLASLEPALIRAAPAVADKYASAVETERLDAHFEMAAAALVGGLTNCVTIASGVGFPNFSITFKGLGIEMAKHSIGHALYVEDDRQAWDYSEQIRAFHFGLIARTMRALNQVPEGDGTMLDRTVVVYLSDGAETHHSLCYEWPFVVLGTAGGRLQSGGRYVQLPDYGLDGHRTLNSFYETLLNVAGISRDGFGSLDPHLDKEMHRGPLSCLLS